MAKRLVVELICDGGHHEETPADRSIPLRIGDAEGELDLCEGCLADRFKLDVLEALVRFSGQPISPKADPLPCPRCDKRPKTQSALDAHRRRDHRLKPDWETPL